MLKIERNVYTIQGKGVWGIFQVSSVAFLIGRLANGPRWHLTLFKPYAKSWREWFHFRTWRAHETK